MASLSLRNLVISHRNDESRWYEKIHHRGPTLDEIEVIEDPVRADQVAHEILASQVEYCGFDCEWVGNGKMGKVQNVTLDHLIFEKSAKTFERSHSNQCFHS